MSSWVSVDRGNACRLHAFYAAAAAWGSLKLHCVSFRFPSVLLYPLSRSINSLLKQLQESQSSRVGPARADRELAYMFKWYNDGIDARRGIRKPDFMWGKTWAEIQAQELWTNIDGPSPGGNQHMPAGGAVDEACSKVI